MASNSNHRSSCKGRRFRARTQGTPSIRSKLSLSLLLVATLLLLLSTTLQSASGLLLLPLPGFYLTSTLLQRRIKRSSDNSDNTNDSSGTKRVSQQNNSEVKDSSIVRPTSSSSLTSSTSSSSSSPSSYSSIGTAATRIVTAPATRAVKKPTSQRDLLISRAAKLRQSIVNQQDQLVALERHIACCNSDGDELNMYNGNGNGNNIVISGISYSLSSSSSLVTNLATRLVGTFKASSSVLTRKIERVHKKIGPNNQQWNNVGEFVAHELFAGLRIASRLAKEPRQIRQLVSDPRTPTLVAHAPAILARLDRLETHVRPIIEGVLNDRQHLASIEPYLDEILERFDDIEPHLPWILKNIDALAPYTGLLLKHVDALLIYANADDMVMDDDDDNDAYDDDTTNNNDNKGKGRAMISPSSSSYSLADQLLPYLEYYVSKLDTIGPHLVLLRPHVPLLLKHNRIAKVSPHIDKLFARGYETRLTASANIDVLLFWFGWTLRIPFAPALFFALPFSPRAVSFLANRLPKKFARRGKSYCRNLECAIDDDYGGSWNKLDKT